MTANEKVHLLSFFLLLTATVSSFTRLSGYFKVLFNAKCESVGGGLQHECGTISLSWVEILGVGFPDSWTQGLACGLGDGFQPSPLLWEAPSGCSEPCQPRLICPGTCSCQSCGNLPVSLWGLCFPKLEPSSVFSSVPWMFVEVYQMPGSVLLSRDPDTNR